MTRKMKCWLVFLILAIGIPAAMLLDRREPITLVSGRIVPFEVRNGGKATVVWRAVEKRACDGEYTRVVISGLDGARQHHAFGIRERTIYRATLTGFGTETTFSRVVDFPTGMVAGPAIYTTYGVRWCNVLQQYFWPIPFKGLEIPFMVLADDAGKRFTDPLAASSQRR